MLKTRTWQASWPPVDDTPTQMLLQVFKTRTHLASILAARGRHAGADVTGVNIVVSQVVGTLAVLDGSKVNIL